jgi:hypothetical protein
VVKDIGYIVCKASGIERMTKMLPNLNPGEVAIKVECEVPEAVFKNMFPTVQIKLAERDMTSSRVTVKAVGEGW